MAFREISIFDLQGNPVQMIAKDWALVTAQAGGRVNPMTISWGGVGNLWNKPVAFIFIRPQRFTYPLIEEADGFSVSFYEERERPQLQYCGTVSGREEDKVAHCGFTTLTDGDIPYFAQAKVVLLCKKLYAQDMTAACALSDTVTKNYPEEDYHRMYVAEITKVLVRE